MVPCGAHKAGAEPIRASAMAASSAFTASKNAIIDQQIVTEPATVRPTITKQTYEFEQPQDHVQYMIDACVRAHFQCGWLFMRALHSRLRPCCWQESCHTRRDCVVVITVRDILCACALR